jgi:hypothetical protein
MPPKNSPSSPSSRAKRNTQVQKNRQEAASRKAMDDRYGRNNKGSGTGGKGGKNKRV